jgi:hypothetical protein
MLYAFADTLHCDLLWAVFPLHSMPMGAIPVPPLASGAIPRSPLALAALSIRESISHFDASGFSVDREEITRNTSIYELFSTTTMLEDWYRNCSL